MFQVRVLNPFSFTQDTLSANYEELKKLHSIQEALVEKHKKFTASKVQRTAHQEYTFRMTRYDMQSNMVKYQACKANIELLEEKIAKLEQIELPSQYLSPLDRRILDWHYANLEFATSSQLDALSMAHWDQDDPYTFDGPLLSVKSGFSTMAHSLADGVDVKLGVVVRGVKQTSSGVQVETVKIDSNHLVHDPKVLAKKLSTSPVTNYQADAVLCTLPLGVLKNSVGAVKVKEDEKDGAESKHQPCPNSIQFSPPLPKRKVDAIQRLGYGNLNKVVLIFESIFWDRNTHLFGNVASSPSTRGELFLYWSCYKQPVLVAFISGKSSDLMEQVDDEIIKQKCLTILETIFKVRRTWKFECDH